MGHINHSHNGSVVAPKPSGSVFGLLWRNKFKATFVFLVVCGLTAAYLVRADVLYQSDAKLFVRVGRESVSLDPTATTGNFRAVADSREREVNAVVELFTSRLMAEQVVDHFGIDTILEEVDEEADTAGGFDLNLSERLTELNDYNLNPLRVYSERDQAIEAYSKNFAVLPLKTSSVLRMSYESADPRLAQRVLEFLLKTGLEENLRTHRTPGSQAFFESQTTYQRDQLDKLEEQLHQLKNETGLASLLTQRELQLQMIGAMRTELIQFSAERDAVEAEMQRRQQQLTSTPEQIVTEQTLDQPNTISQSMREQVYELEVKEQELASKFTADHPLLQSLREQITQARAISEKQTVPVQVTRGLNPAHQATGLALQERNASLVALQARTESLSKNLTEARTELNRLNAVEVKMVKLEREIELARANYRKYADNLEEARINEELQQAKISGLTVMQPPTFSETPVSPEPLKTMAIGFVLACLSSLGVVLLFDRRSSEPLRVRETERRATKPVLAPVPVSETSRLPEPAVQSATPDSSPTDSSPNEQETIAAGEFAGRVKDPPSNPR